MDSLHQQGRLDPVQEPDFWRGDGRTPSGPGVSGEVPEGEETGADPGVPEVEDLLGERELNKRQLDVWTHEDVGVPTGQERDLKPDNEARVHRETEVRESGEREESAIGVGDLELPDRSELRG